MRHLETVDLSLDELEALRLKYLLGNDNASGAKEMKISPSTFQRLVTAAIKKVTQALIEGKAIEVHRVIDFNFPGLHNMQIRQRGGRGNRRRFGRV